MVSETEPLDLLAIGETLVDFISHELAHSLRTAGQFSREETALREFHDLGARVVMLTRSGGMVTVSDRGSVERVGPLAKVHIENVTGGRDAFWSALLVAHLDGKDWSEAGCFAHEVASLKLGAEGHVERMIDRQKIYHRLETQTGQLA